ncbi:uncharacterized protein LOC108696843 isoform X2 [Xenopus laevis]|uniref:Uncharacterized protein n=2 Tax=Xenopus laevis TaxID=8355 RepID=A0A974CHA1_XENLA|nr:uncharacterized protein LOC108696843 isoform X2 [Xenopus laevis]OCT73394.1 hypothetical protein XELAEV_18036371mg [Xenopus laevis]
MTLCCCYSFVSLKPIMWPIMRTELLQHCGCGLVGQHPHCGAILFCLTVFIVISQYCAEGHPYYCVGTFHASDLRNQYLVITKRGETYCQFVTSAQIPETFDCTEKSRATLINQTSVKFITDEPIHDQFHLDYGKTGERGKTAFILNPKCYRSTPDDMATVTSHDPTVSPNTDIPTASQKGRHYLYILAAASVIFIVGIMIYRKRLSRGSTLSSAPQETPNNRLKFPEKEMSTNEPLIPLEQVGNEDVGHKRSGVKVFNLGKFGLEKESDIDQISY